MITILQMNITSPSYCYTGNYTQKSFKKFKITFFTFKYFVLNSTFPALCSFFLINASGHNKIFHSTSKKYIYRNKKMIITKRKYVEEENFK